MNILTGNFSPFMAFIALFHFVSKFNFINLSIYYWGRNYWFHFRKNFVSLPNFIPKPVKMANFNSGNFSVFLAFFALLCNLLFSMKLVTQLGTKSPLITRGENGGFWMGSKGNRKNILNYFLQSFLEKFVSFRNTKFSPKKKADGNL